MSKRIKNLLTQEYAERLSGVDEALLVNVVGIDANKSVTLRQRLREKDIQMVVVRNGLARRATEGSPLSTALAGMDGSLAFVWGAEDFVSLAKEITKLDEDKDFEAFKTRGGVMDGEQLSADRVKEISKWPSRQEQLSILVGQILGPGAELAGAINGPAGTLAGQIKSKSEEENAA